MEGSQREEFRRFVTARTPELFEVAYAVAGRQDRAERLLQSALERLALRWGRTTDPYAYVVRLLRRRSLPWWRRWTGTGRPPPVTEGTGGRGRPVDLGDFALAGARRRRLVRAGAAAAVPVVLAGAAVLVAGGGDDGGGNDDVAPTVDLTGRNVVTSYYDQGTYVLNPDTGEYDFWIQEPGLISPDLRLAARSNGPTVIVSRTTGGDPVHTLDLQRHVAAVTWSPDSRTLAVTPQPDTPDGYTHVLLAEVDTGEISEIAINFPPDRAGWSTTGDGAYWVDADHLAVPTVDTSVPVDPDQEFPEPVRAGWRVPVAVTVIDRTGGVVQELPIDNEGWPPGHAWTPTGLVRDGRHLLFRHAGEDLLEVAAVDLASPSGPYPAVQVPAPELPQPEHDLPYGPFPWPSAWLEGGPVVIEFFSPFLPSSASATFPSTHQMLLVDLDDGSVEPCTPAAAECDALLLGQLLGTELPVPPTAAVLGFGSAAALPEQAARLAF